jgi:2-haloacid dehalogenase
VAQVIVFDVNETLLDLSALRRPFTRAFGADPPVGEWFARLLHASLVATLTDTYEDFGSLGRAALDALAVRHGLDLADADRDAILTTMRELPAHADARPALERLRSAGFPLATLTNSSHDLARAQLDHAGLSALFDEMFSVEDARRYKPAPEPYLMAAERLGVAAGGLRMVAAHDWDVWGAVRAGCAAAYVRRTDVPFMVGRPPDLVASDLGAVVDLILEVDAPPLGSKEDA